LANGGEKEKLTHLANRTEFAGYSRQEHVALELAECITVTDSKIDSKLWGHVKEHFSDDEIVELVGLISFQNLSSKFNAALDIAPQGFCVIPDQSKG
jgi:alkylhydroperoxidase family enzyme